MSIANKSLKSLMFLHWVRVILTATKSIVSKKEQMFLNHKLFPIIVLSKI